MKKEYDYLFILGGIPYYDRIGGINKVIFLLSKFLNDKNYKVAIVFITGHINQVAKINNINFKTKINKIELITNNSLLFIFLKHYFKNKFNNSLDNIDVYPNIRYLKKINSKRIISPWWWGIILSEYYNKKNKYFIIYHNYDDPVEIQRYKNKSEDFKKLIIKSYEISNKIAASKHVYERFINENIPLIKEGIDLNRYITNTEPENKKNFTIMMPLRAEDLKGAKYGIDALKLIHDKIENIEIETFGNYRGNIPNFINHRGYVQISDLKEMYKKSRIFILPSIEEGIPEPLIEAMINGCAAVSTTSGGPSEIIENYVNGILVPIKDPYAIASAVIYLYNNKDKLLEMAKKGILKAKEYDIKNTYGDFLRAIKHYE